MEFCDKASDSPVALLFPGQGSQFPGMGLELRKYPQGAELLKRADEILGYGISSIMCSGSEDELNRTVHTQPAVFIYSWALYSAFSNRTQEKIKFAAGHSLGEYTALCAAGILSFEDALSVIRIRAQGMDCAQPAKTCGMAAVMSPQIDAVLNLIDDTPGNHDLYAANFNSPEQIVVSGSIRAIERLANALDGLKRTRLVPLAVSSAFHTPLMESARVALQKKLLNITIHERRFPVVANATAEFYPDSPDGVRDILCSQVVKPVLWEKSFRFMTSSGITQFLEIGPGKTLCGLAKRIDKNSNCFNIADFKSLDLCS